MHLVDFAASWLSRRDVSPGYASTVLARCRRLENHVGRPEIAACCREESLNRLLAQLADNLAPITVKGWRGDLLTIWRAAADEGLCPYPVTRRIRRVKVPEAVVFCYSADEARAILRAAERLSGGYPDGVGRAAYWSAALRLAWDSGLRRGDVWHFSLDVVDGAGNWRWIQRKTGKLVAGRLHESTVAHLRSLRRTVPCAWPCHANAFTNQFRQLVRKSGVGRGTFKWFRRASGSHVESIAPGHGAKHLGHTNEATFRRHYDAGIAPVDLAQPPEL